MTVTRGKTEWERQIIGSSQDGQPIEANLCFPDVSTKRIAIVAGQHGDELLPLEALNRLQGRWDLGNVMVAVVSNANPDGLQTDTRRTKNGVDLNRDHIALRSPETRCLHAFLRQFKPTLLIDIHQFKSRRKWLNSHGWEHAADLCMDWTTTVVADAEIRMEARRLGARALRDLIQLGWLASRYRVTSGSGVLRPSSPRLISLMNYAAVRYRCPSLLVEMREPPRRELSKRGLDAAERSIESTCVALELLCKHHALPSGSLVQDAAPVAAEVAIRAKAVRDNVPPNLWIRTTPADTPQLARFPGRYRSGWRETLKVKTADAYGIPSNWKMTSAWLRHHGCQPLASHELSKGVVSQAHITSLIGSRNRQGMLRLTKAEWHLLNADVARDAMECLDWYRVSQTSSNLLTALLEPESSYAAIRDGLVPWNPAPLATSSSQHCVYPILRFDNQ